MESIEWTISHLDDLSDFERDRQFLLALGQFIHTSQHAAHLIRPQRKRVSSFLGTQETDHTGCVSDHVRNLPNQCTLHKHISRIMVALLGDLLSVLDLQHLLRRDQNLPHVIRQAGRGNLGLKETLGLVLLPTYGAHYVPLLVDFAHGSCGVQMTYV